MSTPVQFGDVVRALEIILWIKDKCFNPINNASILYVGLKDDILELQKRLEEFKSSFDKAVPNIGTDLSRHRALKEEANKISGDFCETLEQCWNLLKKHAHFDRAKRQATALDNVFWHASTQPEVTELRRRLQSHFYKLFLLSRPLEIDLLAGIKGDTRQILALLQDKEPIRLPRIPSTLRSTLAAALRRDAPEEIDDDLDIPLAEGVDALSRHFFDCISNYNNAVIGRSQQSDLSLLKAHWLYETLEASRELGACRKGSLFRGIVEELGPQIGDQYRMRRRDSWPTDAFLGLDDASFAIWPPKEVPKVKGMTDQGIGEKKLAEVSMHSPDGEENPVLIIFQVKDNLLRAVQSSQIDGSGPQATERFIYLDEDRFIPWYTLSSRNENRGIINMTHGKGAEYLAYDLKSRNSALEVQKAVTGYKTVSWSTLVSCSMGYKRTWKNFRTMQESGSGEVQLWMPGNFDISKLPSSPNPASDSINGSAFTGSSHSKTLREFSSIDTRVLSIADADDGKGIILAQLPKPPLLVAMLRSRSGKQQTFSFWQFDFSALEFGTPFTGTDADGQPLYHTLLQLPRIKPFPVRRLTVERTQLDLWNLRSLQRPIDPKKSKNRDKTVPAVEQLDATSVTFGFKTKEKREKFERHIKYVATERHKQIEDFEEARRKAVSLAHRPSRGENYPDVISSKKPEAKMTNEIRRFTFNDPDVVGVSVTNGV